MKISRLDSHIIMRSRRLRSVHSHAPHALTTAQSIDTDEGRIDRRAVRGDGNIHAHGPKHGMNSGAHIQKDRSLGADS